MKISAMNLFLLLTNLVLLEGVELLADDDHLVGELEAHQLLVLAPIP